MKLLFFLCALMTAFLLTLPVLLLGTGSAIPASHESAAVSADPVLSADSEMQTALPETQPFSAETAYDSDIFPGQQSPRFASQPVTTPDTAAQTTETDAQSVSSCTETETTPEKPAAVVPETASGYDRTAQLTLDMGEETATISLRDYLTGIVMAEMPSYFSDEALRAQAVAARTYVLYRISRGLALSDSSAVCTAYMTEDDARDFFGDAYPKVLERVTAAVDTTDGLVLTYGDALCCTVFHSMSCGTTEDAEALWGQAYPYLVSVESPESETLSGMVTTAVFDEGALCAKLGVAAVLPLTVEETDSGRISSVTTASGDVFSGEQFRTRLGLRSTDITITAQEKAALTLTVHGWGHGVGMSQYGADALADTGYSYEEILAHYYPGTVLSPHAIS